MNALEGLLPECRLSRHREGQQIRLQVVPGAFAAPAPASGAFRWHANGRDRPVPTGQRFALGRCHGAGARAHAEVPARRAGRRGLEGAV